MSDPRFIVTEFTGIPIPQESKPGAGHSMTSFYVQDTLYNYEVIRTYDRHHWGRHLHVAQYRRAAERECARLNEWWEYERKRG